ncbi:hypothetical protein [Cellulomonas sp. HZM]|uniref:hypothetical protein n=1 Tax=Cellulomonas sp. HZM TaxID=1454010 RepID=UPI00068D6D14|nr:hypothetical protein [Cellulomonas sp. HZM]
MTQPFASPAQPPLSESAAGEAFRRALRDMLWLLGILLVLGVGIGWAVSGSKGVWGALLGVALALVFSGTTVISVLRSVNTSPTHTAMLVMGAWLVKIVVVFIALAVLARLDFYDHAVLAAVLLAGVLGSAVLDLRAVQRARIPYVDADPVPGLDPSGRAGENGGSGPAVS